MFQQALAGALLLIPLVDATAQLQPQARPLLELRAGDRVAFVGEEVFGPEREHGFFEQMLTAEAGGAAVTFRHLSLTNGLLASYQPTVVFLHLTPEKFLPGAEAVLSFSNRMETLVSMVQTQAPAQARFVLLGPLPLERRPAPQPDPGPENTTRAGYEQALKQVAAAHQMTFVSLLDALRYEFSNPKQRPTTNGARLNAAGSRQVAVALAGPLLGWPALNWRLSLEPDGAVQAGCHGQTVTKVQRTDQMISFTLLADKVANTPCMLRFKSLPPGRHALKIDGRIVQEATALEWQRALTFTTGPMFEAAEQLRLAIVRKNALLGEGTASEIHAAQARIHQLARPVPHQFEVVPVADSPPKP